MADPLSADPNYMAYLRALGFERSTAEGDAQRQVEQTQQTQAFAEPVIAEQGVQQRAGITAGMEDRGVFRSGETLRRLAEQRQDEGNRTGLLALQTSQSVGDIQGALARELAGLGRQQAERALDIGQSLYLREGLVPYQYP